MSNKVYTYTDIICLKKAPYFAEIAALPQLTMSRETASAIAYDMRIFRGNILGFFNFSMRLFPGWNTSGQKFAYVTALNRFMREKIAAFQDKAEREWLFGCKKNLFFAINNIIRLEEADVRPDDIKSTDRDILLFVEMWKYLEKSDDMIQNFRQRKAELEDPRIFEEEINHIFKFHGNRQIVWNGFQFLTPIQQFVYDCFTRAGYEIFALIQDDERYPYANEIWNYLYTRENGYPEKERWIRQEDRSSANLLGEIFEKGEMVHAPNLKILRYNNTIEFVEDIKRLKEEGFYLYCTDDRATNNFLKDYYPERYEVRNLLAYPIGQFIYTIHKMWDESLQEPVMTTDDVRKCFASGWLCVHGKSSVNDTDDLENILPYFEGCYKLEEWKERLQVFSNTYNDIQTVFDQKDKDPLKYFSFFAVKEMRAYEVVELIKRLLQMAETLFRSAKPVSMRQHLDRLLNMLYMNDGMPQELYLEEKEKVKQIFHALENGNGKDFLCYPGDLASAILSFMSGQVEDGEENNIGLRTLVFNIFQIEAAPVSAKGKVHICMSDITRLPGNTGKYGWPLSEEMLKEIAAAENRPYLLNWVRGNQLTALSNRYYVYTALKNKQVELSWISRQGEKLFSPSPYITLLEKFSDVKIQEADTKKKDVSYLSGIVPRRCLDKQVDLIQEGYGSDPKMEYALCPIRFIYSYVLGRQVSYRNEYQQNRAIVRLIQVLKRLLGDHYDMGQIADQVFTLFPYLRKAERRQMLDDALKWKLPEIEEKYTDDKEQKCTTERYNLMFLDHETYAAARKGVQGTRNCEFCPHSGYCPKSLFGVDYKGEQ